MLLLLLLHPNLGGGGMAQWLSAQTTTLAENSRLISSAHAPGGNPITDF